jgi:hypothetical protein
MHTSFNVFSHPDSEIRSLLDTINELKNPAISRDKWSDYFGKAKSATVNESANKIFTIEKKMVGMK